MSFLIESDILDFALDSKYLPSRIKVIITAPVSK
jgi:hypothetical protein